MIRVSLSPQPSIPISIKKTSSQNVGAGKSLAYISNPDYEALKNKPAINGCVLIGNKTSGDIDINGIENIELEKIINSIF